MAVEYLDKINALKTIYNGNYRIIKGFVLLSNPLIPSVNKARNYTSKKKKKNYSPSKETVSSKIYSNTIQELLSLPNISWWRAFQIKNEKEAVLGNVVIAWQDYLVDTTDAKDLVGLFDDYLQTKILPLITNFPNVKVLNPKVLSKIIKKQTADMILPNPQFLAQVFNANSTVPLSVASKALHWLYPKKPRDHSGFKHVMVSLPHQLEAEIEYPVEIIAFDQRLNDLINILPNKKLIFTKRPYLFNGTHLEPGKHLFIDPFKILDEVFLGHLICATQGITVQQFLPEFLQALTSVKERFNEINKELNTIDLISELEELTGLTISISTQARVLSALKSVIKTVDAYLETNLTLIENDDVTQHLIIDLNSLNPEEQGFFALTLLMTLKEKSNCLVDRVVVFDGLEEFLAGFSGNAQVIQWLIERLASINHVNIRRKPDRHFQGHPKTVIISGCPLKSLCEDFYVFLDQEKDQALKFLLSLRSNEFLALSPNNHTESKFFVYKPQPVSEDLYPPAVNSTIKILPSNLVVEINLFDSAIKSYFSSQEAPLFEIENILRSVLQIKTAAGITTNLQRKGFITGDFEKISLSEQATQYLLEDDELISNFNLVLEEINYPLEEETTLKSPLSPSGRFWILAFIWLFLNQRRDHEKLVNFVEMVLNENARSLPPLTYQDDSDLVLPESAIEKELEENIATVNELDEETSNPIEETLLSEDAETSQESFASWEVEEDNEIAEHAGAGEPFATEFVRALKRRFIPLVIDELSIEEIHSVVKESFMEILSFNEPLSLGFSEIVEILERTGLLNNVSVFSSLPKEVLSLNPVSSIHEKITRLGEILDVLRSSLADVVLDYTTKLNLVSLLKAREELKEIKDDLSLS